MKFLEILLPKIFSLGTKFYNVLGMYLIISGIFLQFSYFEINVGNKRFSPSIITMQNSEITSKFYSLE